MTHYIPSKPCKRGHLKRYARTGDCVECARLRHSTSKYRRRQRNAARKRWAANPEKYRYAQRLRRSKNPDKTRRQGRESMRRRKRFPPPSRPEPKRCECCGRKSLRALALDHCHETHRFRGWLCHACNLGIGLLGDSARGIKRALQYLRIRHAR